MVKIKEKMQKLKYPQLLYRKYGINLCTKSVYYYFQIMSSVSKDDEFGGWHTSTKNYVMPISLSRLGLYKAPSPRLMLSHQGGHG